MRWYKKGGEIVFDRHSKIQSLLVSDTLRRIKNANNLKIEKIDFFVNETKEFKNTGKFSKIKLEDFKITNNFKMHSVQSRNFKVAMAA